jgi:hypothetical protein
MHAFCGSAFVFYVCFLAHVRAMGDIAGAGDDDGPDFMYFARPQRRQRAAPAAPEAPPEPLPEPLPPEPGPPLARPTCYGKV